MKRFSVMMTALLSVFVFASFALAQNRVEVKVTSEPIQFKATCDKGGGFSLEFDSNTTIADGDQITIDLDFGVTLCRDIDIEISNGGNEGRWIGGAVPTTDAPVIDPTGNTIVNGNGVYFTVKGVKGQQRITIDVHGDSLTVGPGATDKLIVKFLDQAVNADFTTPGIYIEGDTEDVYDDDALLADNTLCINVSEFDENTVDGNMDSKADKYTFIPSDPQIAHIVPSTAVTLDPCKNSETGYIRLPEEQGECVNFDYETAEGYCYDTHDNEIILKNSGVFQQTSYQVQLEIVEPSGVYWSDDSVRTGEYDTASDACAHSYTNAVGNQNDYTYLDADGDELDAADIQDQADENCEVDEDAQAVTVTTDAATLITSDDSDYLFIDMPNLIYDNTVQAGQEVKVKVTLIKAPCGEIFSETILVGTFGCPTTATTGTTLVYPYFTAMDAAADVWWDGIVVTNTSSTAGTATVTAYEKDGDVGTIEIPVEGNSLEVGLLSNLLPSMTLATSVDGTLGNSPVYLRVSCDFAAYGFAMIANPATGESMGYLPERD